MEQQGSKSFDLLERLGRWRGSTDMGSRFGGTAGVVVVLIVVLLLSYNSFFG